MISGTRTARKPHHCVTCDRAIMPGCTYLNYTVFPNDDLLGAKVPYRFAECLHCVNARAALRAAGRGAA